MNTRTKLHARPVRADPAPRLRGQPSTLLPESARNELIAAADYMPRSLRAGAIRRAIDNARKNHPSFFRKD